MENILLEPKKSILDKFVYWTFILVVIAIVASIVWQKIQFYRTIHILKSLSPGAIHELKIYPQAAKVGGYFVTIVAPDPLIEDFLLSLADARSYYGSPKGTLSPNHEWLAVLITVQGQVIQMRSHLPANRKNVVHGSFGRFHEHGGGTHYGEFQSQNLYDWYQKYSHRWLGEKKEDEKISIEISP
ncbi:MAG: hypothetical protein GY801_16435 [bacterium]|nr:hypothetical protein [bacterium]